MEIVEKKSYTPTIGLEIHVQLKTKTKMFSHSLNVPDEEEPNVNVSPIDLGHPGTLPTVNKEAIKHVLRVGLAANGQLADYTEFDRKNYFYPDIPKGYQISQYKYPLVRGGDIAGVELTRIHLEEDTGRSQHLETESVSLVDYNRAGIPLMELVTEPVIVSAEQAARFAKELQLLLRYLGASDANLEKGEMRIEANISVSNTDEFGTKVEVKNLNSFKAVERAIAYEIDRHIKVLEEGGEIVQETRGWDENKQVTFSQRSKESAHDYRYFPDPDIPKFFTSQVPEFQVDTLKATLPQLPWERRDNLVLLGISPQQIEIFIEREDLYSLFTHTLSLINKKDVSILANVITSEIIGLESSETQGSISNISSDSLAQLISLSSANKLSSRGVKEVLAVVYRDGGDPQVIATALNLFQVSDESKLKEIANNVIKENEVAVAEFKAGKEASLQYLVGQGMKISKGSANPQKLKEIIESLI